MGTFESHTKPRSLADDFRLRSDSELTSLLRQRHDLISPVPSDISDLSVRATTVHSISLAMNELNKAELTLCEVLAALPDSSNSSAVHDALSSTAGYEQHVINQALFHLWELGLVWGNEENIHLVRTVREFFGTYPCALGPAFADIRQNLRKFSESPDLVKKTLSKATDETQKILLQMVWTNPRGTYPNAMKKVTAKAAQSPVEWLLTHDLLVPIDDSTVAVPLEVALPLRQYQYVQTIECEAPKLVTGNSKIEHVNASGIHNVLEFIQATEKALDELSQHPLIPLRTGGISAKEFLGLAQKLNTSEALLAVVLDIALTARLISLDEQLGWLPTSAYDDWLQQSDEQRWSTLASVWCDMERAPHVVTGASEKINALTQGAERPYIASLRAAVMNCLFTLDTDQVTNIETLTHYLTWKNPRLITDIQQGAIVAIMNEADLLGISSLGTLTTFGRDIINGDDAVASLRHLLPGYVDHIIVQADFTALAPGRLPLEKRKFMTQVSDVESTGVATTFRFGAGSLMRGIDQGLSETDIINGITQLSRTPIPQALAYMIQDVARRHGQLQLGDASVYLRCDDEQMTTAILADRSLAVLHLQKLAPGILISQQPRDIVIARLRNAGYSPALHNSDGTTSVSTTQINRVHITNKSHKPASTIPSNRLIEATIRSMRSDSPQPATDSAETTTSLTSSTTNETLKILNDALVNNAVVWIGYSDKSGHSTEHIVEPLSITSGFLTAFDTRSNQVNTYTILRITGAQLTEKLEAREQGEAS